MIGVNVDITDQVRKPRNYNGAVSIEVEAWRREGKYPDEDPQDDYEVYVSISSMPLDEAEVLVSQVLEEAYEIASENYRMWLDQEQEDRRRGVEEIGI